MKLIAAFFWCSTIFAQIKEEKIPFCVFNRSFTEEDIDVEIFIDDQSLIYTPSIKKTFNLDTSYYTTLTYGTHIIEIHSYQKSIFTVDTVFVDSTAKNSTNPANWLWIDYNFTPSPREQFEFKLSEKINDLSGTTSLDSTALWHRARFETLERKRQFIREEEERNFKVRWGYYMK